MVPDSAHVAELLHRHALVLRRTCAALRDIRDAPIARSARDRLPVTRTAIMAASGTAVEPSYIDALATSMPVSWQIMVWNSKIVVSVPCEISAW